MEKTGLQILQEAIVQAWEAIKQALLDAYEAYKNVMSETKKKQKLKRNWNLEIDTTIAPQVLCRKPLYVNARANL